MQWGENPLREPICSEFKLKRVEKGVINVNWSPHGYEPPTEHDHKNPKVSSEDKLSYHYALCWWNLICVLVICITEKHATRTFRWIENQV